MNNQPDRYSTTSLAELMRMFEHAQAERRRMDAFARHRAGAVESEEFSAKSPQELSEHRVRLLGLLTELRAEIRQRERNGETVPGDAAAMRV